MSFRNILFWVHLSCGVSAGVVVLIMSVTGVILTYERQMIAWADSSYYFEPEAGAGRQALDEIISAAQRYAPENPPTSFTVSIDAAAPVAASIGRDRVVYLSPYSGEVLGEGATGIREFFSFITQWHRWFNLSGEDRTTARVITGASNVIFLFLILSGMYLWLPKAFKWSLLRIRLLFSRNNPTSKARDFNWHHVFGIWACIPLAIVVATATVFSYPTVSNLVYLAFGEDPPVRGRPPVSRANVSGSGNADKAAIRNGDAEGQGMNKKHVKDSPLPMKSLFSRARQHMDNWNTISFRLPDRPADPVTFTIDTGDGGQPHKQSRLILDSKSGEVLGFQPFNSQTPGRQARSLIRRLHTGEALGLVGQTIAGLVSFAGIILVWTGLALAYRRLLWPLFNKG